MFIICIPNIKHDYINIVSDEYNINIYKSNAIFTHDYYLYKINMNLTSSVSYKIKSFDNTEYLISTNIDANNNNYILTYKHMYDTGFAKIYHEKNGDIIMLINDKIVEIEAY